LTTRTRRSWTSLAGDQDRAAGPGGIRDLSEEEHQRIESSGGRIVTFYDAELAEKRFAGEPWAAQCAPHVAKLPKLVYVSFDVDGLDPALCPHTGTKVRAGSRSRWRLH